MRRTEPAYLPKSIVGYLPTFASFFLFDEVNTPRTLVEVASDAQLPVLHMKNIAEVKVGLGSRSVKQTVRFAADSMILVLL